MIGTRLRNKGLRLMQQPQLRKLLWALIVVVEPLHWSNTQARFLYLITVVGVLCCIVIGSLVTSTMRFVLFGATLATMVVAVPFSYGACTIPLFSFLLLPDWLVLSGRFRGYVATGIFLLVFEAGTVQLPPHSGMISVAAVLVAAITSISSARARHLDSQLKIAHAELEHLSRTSERERIGRDLHDVLGQSLTLMILKAGVAEQAILRKDLAALQELRELRDIGREALGEVRQTVAQYRPEGIKAEMARAKDICGAAGIDCHTSIENSGYMEQDKEGVVSLVVREAVTNVVRHSSARKCYLAWRTIDASHEIIIRDDGVGLGGHEGNGLKHMRERVAELGGKLTVEDVDGVRVTILV